MSDTFVKTTLRSELPFVLLAYLVIGWFVSNSCLGSGVVKKGLMNCLFVQSFLVYGLLLFMFNSISMKYSILLIVLIFALSVAQEYSMGTREQPKPDLPPDSKLIIQNLVLKSFLPDIVVYP